MKTAALPVDDSVEATFMATMPALPHAAHDDAVAAVQFLVVQQGFARLGDDPAIGAETLHDVRQRLLLVTQHVEETSRHVCRVTDSVLTRPPR